MALRSRRLLRALLAALACPAAGTSAPAVPPRTPASASAPSRPGVVAFRRVAVPEDVPAHLVSSMAQDRAGFLWFGTQGGLVRWDGYEFRVFRADARDPSALSGAYVRSLCAARDGRVWAGTFSGGVSVYDPATESFTRLRHDPTDAASLAHDRVEGLAEDRDGAIWAATSAGLDRIDPVTGRAAHFVHEPANPRSLADDRVRSVLVDRDGTLWVGSGGGLQRRGRGGFERVPLGGDRPDLVVRLYQDRRGRIWAGTSERGAAVVDPHTLAARRFLPRPEEPDGLSHFWVYGFAEALDGRELWIATFGGGIDVLDSGTLRVVDRLRSDPSLGDAIGGDRIGALLADRAGVIWVGTWGQGIARHDPSSRPFRMLHSSPLRPDGLSHPSAVRALPMADGTIWVGTNGSGVDVLDAGLRRTGGFRPDPKDPGALADGAVTCLAQSPDGTAWVATLDGTLHLRRRGASRFERVPGLPGGQIRAMAITRDGALWAGSSAGLARIDPRTLAVQATRRWPGTGDAALAVESLAETADGTLFVGTDSGLFARDPRTGAFARIARDPARADSLPDNWVPDLMVARDGRLWAGTAGGAAVLASWDGARARFEIVSDLLGRLPAPAEQLLEDDEGRVWIGPRLRVDLAHRTAEEFGPADGCTPRTFFIASRARTRDGLLLFGSPEGLLVVDPHALRAWTFAPPVVATALEVNGRALPAAAAARGLTVPPGTRGFRVEFAALDFTAPERNRYRWRLEGYERE